MSKENETHNGTAQEFLSPRNIISQNTDGRSSQNTCEWDKGSLLGAQSRETGAFGSRTNLQVKQVDEDEQTVKINPILQTTIKTTATFGDRLQIEKLAPNSSSSLDAAALSIVKDGSKVVSQDQQPYQQQQKSSGKETNDQQQMYAKPIQLIQLIANKVEPQSKVYHNQSHLMMQHQFIAQPFTHQNNSTQGGKQVHQSGSAAYFNSSRIMYGQQMMKGSDFQVGISKNASTLMHQQSHRSSRIQNSNSKSPSGLFISGNGSYKKQSGSGVYQRIVDFDGTMELINSDLLDEASNKVKLQPKHSTKFIRDKNKTSTTLGSKRQISAKPIHREQQNPSLPSQKAKSKSKVDPSVSNSKIQQYGTSSQQKSARQSPRVSIEVKSSPREKVAVSQQAVYKNASPSARKTPTPTTSKPASSVSKFDGNKKQKKKATTPVGHQSSMLKDSTSQKTRKEVEKPPALSPTIIVKKTKVVKSKELPYAALNFQATEYSGKNQQSHIAFQARGDNHFGLQLQVPVKRMSNKTKRVSSQESSSGGDSAKDIEMANQISNESLLSKTDIFESQVASKMNLPPKFNAASPFLTSSDHIKKPNKKYSNGKKSEMHQTYRDNRKRHRKNPKEVIEATINTSPHSLNSKDATMTLENLESRDGAEVTTPIKLSFQGSNKFINQTFKDQASFTKRDNESKSSASPTGSLELGNPLKSIANDLTLQKSLMQSVTLNEVQTTSSFMKIKPPVQVHKNLSLMKGPALISQQNVQLLGSPKRKKRGINQTALAILPWQLNVDIQSVSPPLNSFQNRMAVELQFSRTQMSNSKLSEDTRQILDQITLEGTLGNIVVGKQQPLELKQQMMISEIAELMSKESLSCHPLASSQEGSSRQDNEQQQMAIMKNRFDNKRSNSIMVTNEEKTNASQFPAQKKKRHVGSISLKPEGKRITVNAATKADAKFNSMVKDCVNSLRVHKDQKQNMIKLLNEDFKAKFTKREFSPNGKSAAKKKMNQTYRTRNHSRESPTKGITDPLAAIQLAQQRNAFSKARNSLPIKQATPKPWLAQQASPQMRYAPNQIKIAKFGGRFFTDTRRAFSLGIPVPPGPVPNQPVALLLGRQMPLSPLDDDQARRVSLMRNGKGQKERLGRPPYYFEGQGGDSPNGHHKYRFSKKHLPSILSPHMLPEFPNTGEITDSVEHGYSAFTKSVIMDNDTQTNFNIVDYNGQITLDDDLVFDKGVVQILPHKFKGVQFEEPRQQTTLHLKETSSQFVQEQQESQEWLDLAQEIVRQSESTDGDREKVNIPLPQLLEHNNHGLVNLEIDQGKIAEIKDALDEYHRLKNQEERKVIVDEEMMVKEYDRSRRRRTSQPAAPSHVRMVKPNRKPIELRETHNKLGATARLQQQAFTPLKNKELKMVDTSQNSADIHQVQRNPHFHDPSKPQKTLQIFKRYAAGSKENSQTMPGSDTNSRNFSKTQVVKPMTQESSATKRQVGKQAYRPDVDLTVRDQSPNVLASQGGERHMSINSSATRNQARAAYTHAHLNFLGTEKVDTKRVKMEQYNSALEAQLEKKKNGLERGLKAHVNEGVNKHIGTIRNRQGSFVRVSGDTSFEQKQLVSHRQGHMLDKLKKIQNLANPDTQQSEILRKFIQSELNKAIVHNKSKQETKQNENGKAYLPSIGNQNLDNVEGAENAKQMLQESLYSMQFHLSQEGGIPSQHSYKQLDSEIQQFERRNKLLAGIYKNNPSQTIVQQPQCQPTVLDQQCQRINERVEFDQPCMVDSQSDLMKTKPILGASTTIQEASNGTRKVYSKLALVVGPKQDETNNY